MPDSLLKPGRYLFALSMIFFGFQHFTYAVASQGLVPGPPWLIGDAVLGGRLWALAAGVVLIVGGVSLAGAKRLFWPAVLMGAGLSLYGLVLYVPGMVLHPREPLPWTRSTELLAMGAATWIFAGSAGSLGSLGRRASTASPLSQSQSEAGVPPAAVMARLAAIGRLCFAISAVVWGIQHFMYARFTATIVPAWVPWRLFFACFVGAAFIAAAMSIVANIQVRLSAAMLGLMFFLIVVMVHIPRVVANLHNNREWTSAFVALTMCGASLMIAQSSRPQCRVAPQRIAAQPVRNAAISS